MRKTIAFTTSRGLPARFNSVRSIAACFCSSVYRSGNRTGPGATPLTWIVGAYAFASPRLTAINASTGDVAWQIRLGITDQLPEGKQNTGRPALAGAIVTAGGVLFIAATDDNRFRAFDAKTGKELWVETLPAGSHSVPITYLGRNDKQYVVFPSTGGSLLQDPALSDSLLAYALP